eukprot:2944789-Heterocapsa_arctica.AAC.1
MQLHYRHPVPPCPGWTTDGRLGRHSSDPHLPARLHGCTPVHHAPHVAGCTPVHAQSGGCTPVHHAHRRPHHPDADGRAPALRARRR